MKERAIKRLTDKIKTASIPRFYDEIIREWFNEEFESLSCKATVDFRAKDHLGEEALQEHIKYNMRESISDLLINKMNNYSVKEHLPLQSTTYAKSIWVLKE